MPSLAVAVARPATIAFPTPSLSVGLVTPSAASLPAYDILTLTFPVTGLAAGTNPLLPYSASGVGIPRNGVTVDGLFLPPGESDWNNAKVVPAVWVVGMLVDTQNGLEHQYPNGTDGWQVRFAPRIQGVWTYRVRATDGTGTVTSGDGVFTATAPVSAGFLHVSPTDPRYFEHDDGTVFLGAGHGTSFPTVASATALFARDAQYGANFHRAWAHTEGAQSGSFSWRQWSRIGTVDLVTAPAGAPAADQQLAYQFNTGSGLFNFRNGGVPVPTLPSTSYRLDVTYKATGLVNSGGTAGLNVRTANWPSGPYPNQQIRLLLGPLTSTTWATATATVMSGPADYFLDNGASIVFILEHASAGTIHVADATLRQDLGGGNYGANLLRTFHPDSHRHFDPFSLARWDAVFSQAQTAGAYVKALIGDNPGADDTGAILWFLKNDGTYDDTNRDNFYWPSTSAPADWHQKAWWRYVVGRWGCYRSLFGLELINESDLSRTGNAAHASNPALAAIADHADYADYFASYIHSIDPHGHLVSTSTQASWSRAFWSFAHIDHADVHVYSDDTGDLRFTDPATNTDGAEFMKAYGALYGALEPTTGADTDGGVNKPVVFGEFGISSNGVGENPALMNDTHGVWLHTMQMQRLDASGAYPLYWFDNPGAEMTNNLYRHYGDYRAILAGIPLANGHYADAAAVCSSGLWEAVGQKDALNHRAHVWARPRNYTWQNVVNSVTPSAKAGTVTVGGFVSGNTYTVNLWCFDTTVTPTTSSTSLVANGSGQVVLDLTTLSSGTIDVAATILPAIGGGNGTFTLAGPNAAAALPSNHLGNITLTLVGTNTAWDGTTVFTVSGVSGWAKVSQSVTNATHATVVVSCPAVASPPTGAIGSLTLTETVTGGATQTIQVARPTLSANPNSGPTGTNASTAFTGANTLWQGDNPQLTLSGGTGASIGATTNSSNVASSATVTYGSAVGTLTVTDPSTGAQVAIAVAAGGTFTVRGPNSATTLPANHNGNIVLTLVGTGTSWTGSTVFTVAGVSGWAKVSQSVSDGTHATVTVSCPAVASPPVGATGTLTITETVTGAGTQTIPVNTPTLAANPNSGTTGGSASTAFVGTNTLWQGDNPQLSLAGGTGASIGATTNTTNVASSATVTYGTTVGTETITDPSTGAQATITVTAVGGVFSLAGPNGAASLPSNHNGSITLTLVGTGTAWSGSTVFAVSGIGGWSKVSQNVADATHATVVVAGPGVASPPSGATGTLVVTETLTGSAVATIPVATPTLSVASPFGLPGGSASTGFVGVNTLWLGDNPQLSLAGGVGASVGATTSTTNTAASATVTYGSASGALVLTDPSTGAQATVTVGAINQRLRWPYGFAVLKEYGESNDGQSVNFDPNAFVCPLVDGVVGRIGWWYFYTDPTNAATLDWSITDGWFAKALAANKWLQLIVMGGAWTPTWAINTLTQWNGSAGDWDYFVADESLLQNSRQGPLTGMLTATVNGAVGIPCPFPWSANYLTAWTTFLTAVAARYANHPALAGVVVGGGGAYSNEMHLPDADTNSINRWIDRGYTPTKYLTAYQTLATAHKTLFPNAMLLIPTHATPPIDDTGARNSDAASTTRANICAGIDAILGIQGCFGSSGLNASRQAAGYQLVRDVYSGKRFCFFQETTSSAKHPDNQDVAGATPAQAVTDVIANGMSCGAGVMQIQLYQPTVLYDYLPTFIQSKSSAASATNTTITFSTALTAGSGLVAAVASDGNADPVFTGLTGWTKIASRTFGAGSNSRVTVWTRPRQAGDGTTVTATVSGATQIDLAVYEFAQLVTGGAITVDRTSTAVDAGSTVNTLAVGPTSALAQARELAFIAVGLSGTNGGSDAFTGGFAVGETPVRLLTGWQAVDATTALSSTASWATARRAGAIIATIKAGPQGPVSDALVAARASYFARLTVPTPRAPAATRPTASARPAATTRPLA